MHLIVLSNCKPLSLLITSINVFDMLSNSCSFIVLVIECTIFFLENIIRAMSAPKLMSLSSGWRSKPSKGASNPVFRNTRTNIVRSISSDVTDSPPGGYNVSVSRRFIERMMDNLWVWFFVMHLLDVIYQIFFEEL